MNKKTTTTKQSPERTMEFADSYVLYLRRSTDDHRNQQNSLAYQLTHCLRYAKDRGLSIAAITINGFCEDGVIREKHTAYKTNGLEIGAEGKVSFDILRPKFQKLVHLLELRQFKGVIAYSLDRLTRNDLDKSIVKQMMRSGTVDVRTVIADYERSSAGDLHFDVDGMVAAHHSRVTSERIRAANAKLLAEGKWPWRAAIGYLDNGSSNKPLDPQRAPLVKQILELAATGEWSLSQLHAWARQHGLVTKPWRGRRTAQEIMGDEDDDDDQRPAVCRPASQKMIEKIVHNPFYAGLLETGNTVQKGIHEPLITLEMYRQIQRAFKERSNSIHYIDKRFFTYRGIVRCSCGCTFSPYEQKSHIYYRPYCAPLCTQKRPNLSETAIDGMVIDLLARVRLSDQELADLEAERPTFLSREAQEQKKAAELRAQKRLRVQRDLKYLDENRLMLLRQAVYTAEQYGEEARRLEGELLDLDAQERDRPTEEKLATVLKFTELVHLAQQSYEYANPEQKRQLLLWMSTELVVADGKVANLSPKKGFEEMLSRGSLPYCSPKFVFPELDRLYVAASKAIKNAPEGLGA